LSSAAGYPIGAKLLSGLVQDGRIDNATAADMQCYCYMGGPAYFCGVVGLTLFDSVRLGLLIFAVIFLSNIVCGIIIGRKNPLPHKNRPSLSADISAVKFLSAVTDGGKSILIMSGIIVFFATFNCMLERLGFFTILSSAVTSIFSLSNADGETALRSVIEVTNVTRFIPGNTVILPLLTALLSFGGICVTVQILQFSSDFIALGRFMVYRIFAAVTSFFLMKTALILFPSLTAVHANTVNNGGFTQGTVVPSIMLLCMSVILLTFDIGYRKNRNKRGYMLNNGDTGVSA
jgi:hypothetical protein